MILRELDPKIQQGVITRIVSLKMAKKQTHKPNFSKMTTKELKDACDSGWPTEILNCWKMEMFQRNEPLEKKLAPYLDLSGIMGPILRHPLFVGDCDPEQAAFVHWVIEHKQNEIDRLVLKRKWYQVVFMYETEFLLDAFGKYSHRFDDRRYWQILGGVWIHQEQVWSNRKLYLQLFQSPRPQRDFLMSAAERRKLDGLPEEFPVYRGFIGKRGKGLSWTLDRLQAEWFARRFSILTELGQPRLMEGNVKKSDVLAYFNAREEMEIVVDPAKVLFLKIHPIHPRDTPACE